MRFTAKRFASTLALTLMTVLLAACPGSGSAVQITLVPTSVQLAPGETFEFVANVSGTDNTNVSWEMTSGSVSGSGPAVTYTAPTLIGSYTLTAISQADPSRKASATVEVDGEVGITISPSTVRLAPGDTFAFSAAVVGLEDQSVRWEASGGEIAGTGTTVTYTAPDATGTHIVTAISQLDETLRAAATVEVVAGASSASITLEPSNVRLAAGAVQEFTATVTGLQDTAVQWETSSGSVTGTGTTISYTAPSEIGTYTLTVTSQADSGLSAVANIKVIEEATPAPDPTPEPGEWCGRIKFAATSGIPGDHIGISGLPSQIDSLIAIITVPNTTGEAYALIVDGGNASDPYALLVPVHPSAPIGGGVVNVQLSNGSQTCNPQSFEIESLGNPNDPAVKGAFGKSVTTLQQSLSQQAAEAGIDVAALKGDLSKLPTEYLSFGLAQFLLDHPLNPNSLVTIENRGSVIIEGETIKVDLALLDVFYHRFQDTNPAALKTSAITLPCVGSAALASAETLNKCMNYTGTFDQAAAINKFVRPFIDEVAIASLIIPGIAGYMAPVLIYAKLASFFVEHASEIATTQLPASIKAMTFQASPKVFDTDSQSGSWDSVNLTVTDSKEYDASNLALDFINLMLSQLFNKAKVTKDLKDLLDHAYDIALDESQRIFFDGVKALKQKAKVSFKLPPIPYSTMGTVDITLFSSGYTSQVRGGSVITVTSHTGRTYKPVSPLKKGSANLVLQLEPGYFNNSGLFASQSITVEAEEEVVLRIVSVTTPGRVITISYEYEGEPAFPLVLTGVLTNCSFPYGCGGGGSQPVSEGENPIRIPTECNENTGTASYRFTLKDSNGVTSNSLGGTVTC